MIIFQKSGAQFMTILVISFILSFYMSFSVGANDVANFFGTSVGTKTLTMLQAGAIASVFELSGALLLGIRVADTIRRGIVSIDDIAAAYANSETCLRPNLGNVTYNPTALNDDQRDCSALIAILTSMAALIGSTSWLTIANTLGMPVSTTHSIVGSTLGAGLVALEGKRVKWDTVIEIVLSWVFSPILSGVISVLLYIGIDRLIMRAHNSVKRVMYFVPIGMFCTLFINAFSVLFGGSSFLNLDKLPVWGVVIIAFGLGGIFAVISFFAINPFMKKRFYTRYSRQLSALNKRFRLAQKMKNKDKEKDSDTYKDTVGSVGDVAEIENETNESSDVKGPVRYNSSHDNLVHRESMETPNFTNDKVIGFGCNNVEQTLIEKSIANDNIVNTEEINDYDIKELDAILNEPVGVFDMKKLLKGKDFAELTVKEVNRITRTLQSYYMFTSLQIVIACFGAFGHGGNDISNSISPIINVWTIYTEGAFQKRVMPQWWIVLFGGAGIVFGLMIMGRNVVKTIGSNITDLCPPSAFSVEFGSALTVLIATRIGMPVSTTHCQIGSVIFTGLYRNGWRNINKSCIGGIIFSWLITLPVSGFVSAAAFAGLRATIMYAYFH